ncbi:MAG: arginase [Bacteroidia bacterium]|nr:arginase [Bacteroidia bacterium]MDW8333276.1 arginase [Bacteroidia bacterium]
MEHQRQPHFVFVKSDFGAGNVGASLGPDAVRMASVRFQSELFNEHPGLHLDFVDRRVRLYDDDYPFARRIEAVREVYQSVSREVAKLLKEGKFPIVISGDHSSACATIAGLRMAMPQARIGAIWIDAHADLHTPFTSPSGNLHGMPLGCALALEETSDAINPVDPETAEIWRQLCKFSGFSPLFDPENLVFIALRDYEEQEINFIRKRGVEYFTPDEVTEKGVEAIVAATFERLNECDTLYVSFDIDSLDASLVPGTGTPVSNGLTVKQASRLLEEFWRDRRLTVFEMTEINPLLDVHNQTGEIAYKILQYLFDQTVCGESSS